MNMSEAGQSKMTTTTPIVAANRVSNTLASAAPQLKGTLINPQYPQHNSSYGQKLYQIQHGLAGKPQQQAQTSLSVPTVNNANSGVCPTLAQIQQMQLGKALDQSCQFYPVASSGWGYVHPTPSHNHIRSQPHDHPPAVAGATSGHYRPPRSLMMPYSPSQVVHPFLVGHPDSNHSQSQTVLQSQSQPIHIIGPSIPNTSLPPSSIRGLPVSAHPCPAFKANSSQVPAPEVNGHRALGERSKDDACVTIRDRKVRISDGSSMYALCRSWLRDGYPDDLQPQTSDIMRSLPRPAPALGIDDCSPESKDVDEKEENDMDESTVESLSPQELLQQHIKRAKRVRARLKEERLRRITRYKNRLALLLPTLVEQCRDDGTG